MKLYFSSGACSMSVHILLNELGRPFEVQKVDFDLAADAATIEKLNPMGAVPTLILDDGQVLTENAAIALHLADLKPEAKLLPPAGTLARARVYEWLSFTSSEIHKAFVPLFMEQGDQAAAHQHLDKVLKIADARMAGKTFCAGEQFSAADPLLFVVYGWCKWVEHATDSYKNLNAFAARMFERASVQKTMKAEGLLN